MKIESYQFPKSSFLSVEKDLNLIVSMMLKNDRLQKLLYYTTPDCLKKPNLTEEQKLSLFGNQIRIVPKIEVEPTEKNYITIVLNDFTPNETNPEFRDNKIYFDIVCHLDNWALQDFQLRPFRIAAEIDSMFNGKHLTGIGELQFVGAKLDIFDEKLGGMALSYNAIHGGEDKHKMPNPADEASFIEDFNKLYNEDEE